MTNSDGRNGGYNLKLRSLRLRKVPGQEPPLSSVSLLPASATSYMQRLDGALATSDMQLSRSSTTSRSLLRW